MTKLIAAGVLLVVAITIAVTGTYSWFVLSTAPEVSGMQITIGGANTILIAPDIAQSTQGGTVHYPGQFSQTMNLTHQSDYDHLDSVRGLRPVSTADGLHWYIPSYTDLTQGGELRDISKFVEDTTLEYANRTENGAGNYIYFDFWVVAPANQTLRVSTSLSQQDSAGSFVIARPEITADENGEYLFSQTRSQAEACVRLGFLVNEEEVPELTMTTYLEHYANRGTYHSLRGNYQNAGQEIRDGETARFTIFEPNGDSHPTDPAADGSYLITEPIGPGKALSQISSILSVQRTAAWTAAETGETKLSQALQSALLQAQGSGVSLGDADAVSDYLFDTYLQNQLAGYVTAGRFICKTQNLYQAAQSGPVGAETLDGLSGGAAENVGGATEDVYIVKLKADVPQRIRMFIWLEGQDADCVGSALADELIVNLELAGESGGGY